MIRMVLDSGDMEKLFLVLLKVCKELVMKNNRDEQTVQRSGGPT